MVFFKVNDYIKSVPILDGCELSEQELFELTDKNLNLDLSLKNTKLYERLADNFINSSTKFFSDTFTLDFLESQLKTENRLFVQSLLLLIIDTLHFIGSCVLYLFFYNKQFPPFIEFLLLWIPIHTLISLIYSKSKDRVIKHFYTKTIIKNTCKTIRKRIESENAKMD